MAPWKKRYYHSSPSARKMSSQQVRIILHFIISTQQLILWKAECKGIYVALELIISKCTHQLHCPLNAPILASLAQYLAPITLHQPKLSNVVAARSTSVKYSYGYFSCHPYFRSDCKKFFYLWLFHFNSGFYTWSSHLCASVLRCALSFQFRLPKHIYSDQYGKNDK